VPEDNKQILVVVSANKDYWIEKDKMSESQFETGIRRLSRGTPAAPS